MVCETDFPGGRVTVLNHYGRLKNVLQIARPFSVRQNSLEVLCPFRVFRIYSALQVRALLFTFFFLVAVHAVTENAHKIPFKLWLI